MSIDFIKSLYYEFLSYFIPKRVKYKITGSCNKCGNCCRNIHCYGLKNKKDFKYMQLIFPWYKNFYIKEQDPNGEFILSCKHIKEDNTCAIYNKRPIICKQYPLKPKYNNYELPPYCSYKITKKDFKDFL